MRRAGVEVLDKPPEGFSAGRALRRAGFTARSAGQRASSSYGTAGRYFAQASGLQRVGVGGFLIFAGFSILGLALLRAALGGKGPAAVDKIFALAGGSFQKLLSPTDPIIGHGDPLPAPTSGAPPGLTGPVGTPTGGAGLAPGLVGPVGSSSGGLATVPAGISQRSGIQVARGVLAAVESVAGKFGVKVSSGFRSSAHNAEVGGAPKSDHLTGDAADFVGTPAALSALYAWAIKQGFPYVEPLSQSKDHVHISFKR
jgi:hypothetical protein